MATIILGNGILGKTLKTALPDKGIISINKEELDLETATLYDVQDVFSEFNISPPDVIINAAAYTNVDLAEEEKEKALNINARGVYALATVCKQYDAHLIHISTDFVFDGDGCQSYTEYDETKPINWYGHTKLMGDKMIKDSGCSYCIVRTGYLYNDTNGIIPSLIKKVLNNEKLYAVTDQIIAPTYATDLVYQISEIKQERLTGVYHASSNGEASPMEILTFISQELGVERTFDDATLFSLRNGGRARRPIKSILDNFNLRSLGLDQMPHWKSGVKYLCKRALLEEKT